MFRRASWMGYKNAVFNGASPPETGGVRGCHVWHAMGFVLARQ